MKLLFLLGVIGGLLFVGFCALILLWALSCCVFYRAKPEKKQYSIKRGDTRNGSKGNTRKDPRDASTWGDN